MHKPAHAQASRAISQHTAASTDRLDPTVIHTSDSLKTRVFFDEPVRPIECAGFVKPHDPQDHRWLRVGAASAA